MEYYRLYSSHVLLCLLMLCYRYDCLSGNDVATLVECVTGGEEPCPPEALVQLGEELESGSHTQAFAAALIRAVAPAVCLWLCVGMCVSGCVGAFDVCVVKILLCNLFFEIFSCRAPVSVACPPPDFQAGHPEPEFHCTSAPVGHVCLQAHRRRSVSGRGVSAQCAHTRSASTVCTCGERGTAGGHHTPGQHSARVRHGVYLLLSVLSVCR